MNRALHLVILLAATCLVLAPWAPAGAAQNPEFPPDPPGVTVIDRAAERVHGEKSGFSFYAILYNRGGHGVVDIYRGTEKKGKEKHVDISHMAWRKVHTWNLVFQGSPVLIETPTLLAMSVQEKEVQFAIVDHLAYQEARVTMYLTYDIRKGTFHEGFVD